MIYQVIPVETRIDRQKAGKNKYLLSIGNGYVGYFPSKRKANEFASQTNRFLERQVMALNNQYAIAFVAYRKIWPMLENNRHDKKLPLGSIQSDLRQGFKTIDFYFDRVHRQSSSTSGNYFVFMQTIAVADQLVSIFGIIRQFWQSRHNPADIFEIEQHIEHTITILQRCKKYGHEELPCFDYRPGEILKSDFPSAQQQVFRKWG